MSKTISVWFEWDSATNTRTVKFYSLRENNDDPYVSRMKAKSFKNVTHASYRRLMFLKAMEVLAMSTEELNMYGLGVRMVVTRRENWKQGSLLATQEF